MSKEYVLGLTSFDITQAYFIALSSAFTKITDYDFHVRPGRKEMVDRTVELLFRRHSDLDTFPKDTLQNNFESCAVFAKFGPLSQFLDRLCMLSLDGIAFLQRQIMEIWRRISGEFPQDLGSAHGYGRVFPFRKFESLNLC
jgi:hypothetical protein